MATVEFALGERQQLAVLDRSPSRIAHGTIGQELEVLRESTIDALIPENFQAASGTASDVARS